MRRLFLLICLFSAGFATAAPQATKEVPYGAHGKQKFDVYWDDATQGAPVIIMLHGGAWAIGDKSNRSVWRNKVAFWRPRGHVFVSVNTRLLPDALPATQVEDFARAVAAIQKRARDWGGDPDRIILMGHSAGAHIAALLGTDLDLQNRHGIRGVRGSVVLDSAALDLEAVMADQPRRLYRKAFGTDPAVWRALSPIRQIDRGAAPTLVVCSTLRQGICNEARRFSQTAASLNVRVDVLPIRLRHRAINADLGKAPAYTKAVSNWIENLP